MVRKKDPKATVDIACFHTLKKFELIEGYAKAWAQKLLNYKECNGIVFIDCMCSSGVYQDSNGNEVFGTPIRIASYLSKIMQKYRDKQAWCYFNDLSTEKIETLNNYLPSETDNFHIVTKTIDGNALLKSIDNFTGLRLHNLLVYDPFEAAIDWEALIPFINNWSDIIINHMVSDPIRAIPQVKRTSAKEKYERTYLTTLQKLTTFSGDREAFEKRIKEIMIALHRESGKRYYIASFPFFNRRNALVYNLILGSGNIEGFKLFKKVAWQTFGGKSSTKNTHGTENQYVFDLSGEGAITTKTDENCYYPQDIVKYLHEKFKGRANVTLDEVWNALDEHPVFPSEGYRPQIKSGLTSTYGDMVAKTSITFTERR